MKRKNLSKLLADIYTEREFSLRHPVNSLPCGRSCPYSGVCWGLRSMVMPIFLKDRHGVKEIGHLEIMMFQSYTIQLGNIKMQTHTYNLVKIISAR